MIEQLRAELAERSPCEADECHGWQRCARWLRDQDAELAEWLELTLTGSRREGDRGRLRAVIERALKSRDPLVERLWRGELGWSLWFGPFVLAYVGPPTLSLTRLRDALGLHGELLADERAWVHGDPDRERVAALERGVPLLLTNTLPGAQQRIYADLLVELRMRFGEQAYEGQALQQRGRGPWRVAPEPLPEGRAVVSLATGETLLALDWERVRELDGVAVVGPPELLSRWPDPGRREPCFAPLPSFERRYQQLGAQHPALFGQLRAELDERPLAEAHTCPSWPVYRDWLLDQGEALLAEWLRLDLDQRHGGKPVRARQLTRLADALAPLRPPAAAMLRTLWSGRDNDTHGARSMWLGPFMLAYVDPQLLGGIGADELQASLGRHATFLPRARVYTDLDRRWLEQAMTPRGVPVLAPTPPGATSIFGMTLRELHDDDDERGLARRVRMALPGSVMEESAERAFATNIGPIAADHEAIAVICCETHDDVRRHAERWHHLQTFEHVVLLGTAEVLARWPHPGERIDPWRAGAAS